MTENKYRLSTTRLLNIFLVPTITILIIVLIPILKYGSVSKISYEAITIMVILLFVSILPFAFLFFNHLHLAISTELFFSNNSFTIKQEGHSETYKLSDGLKVTEYSTRRFPWSAIVKWEIYTSKKTYKISSLSISRLSFERYFYNKTDHIIKVFPTI